MTGIPPLRPLDEVPLPVLPLTQFLEATGGVLAALRPDLDPLAVARYRRMIRNAQRTGVITVADADLVAAHGVGCHPSRIWGKEWWAVNDRA